MRDNLRCFDSNKNCKIKMPLTPFCLACMHASRFQAFEVGPWVAKIERLTHVFDRLVCRDIDMLRVFENERASFSTSCSLGKFQKSSKVGLGYRYSTQQSEICLLCQKIITKTDLPEPIRLPSVCLVIINSSCSECIWWN